MIGKAKDRMIGPVAKRLLEGKLERYGDISSLSVDSKSRRMSLEFHPAGEDRPIMITIEEYRIFKDDDGIVIRLERVTATRVWVAHLLEDFVVGLEIPVGGVAAKFADWLL